MAKPSPYRKVKGGRGANLAGRYSLWLGADHLLHVSHSFGVENYRRYYFADVKALAAVVTRGRTISTAICILVATPFLIAGLMPPDNAPETRVVWLGFFIAIAILAAVNVLLGPTARLYIRTSDRNQRLEGIRRLGQARTVIEQLAPLILSAQPDAEAPPSDSTAGPPPPPIPGPAPAPDAPPGPAGAQPPAAAP